jgi:hypothetical protein
MDASALLTKSAAVFGNGLAGDTNRGDANFLQPFVNDGVLCNCFAAAMVPAGIAKDRKLYLGEIHIGLRDESGRITELAPEVIEGWWTAPSSYIKTCSNGDTPRRTSSWK